MTTFRAVAHVPDERFHSTKGRRRLLLRRSAAPVVLALLLAGKLLTMYAASASAADAFAQGSADGVAAAAGWMEQANVVERHKAAWARGDAAALAGDYNTARSAFERALGWSDPASLDGCRLRVNLGLADEHLAAAALGTGVETAARDRLTEISEIVAAAPASCLASGSDTGARLTALGERTRAALAALDVPVVLAPGGGSIAERQKALLDRLRESERERARSGPGTQEVPPTSPPGPDVTPW